MVGASGHRRAAEAWQDRQRRRKGGQIWAFFVCFTGWTRWNSQKLHGLILVLEKPFKDVGRYMITYAYIASCVYCTCTYILYIYMYIHIIYIYTYIHIYVYTWQNTTLHMCQTSRVWTPVSRWSLWSLWSLWKAFTTRWPTWMDVGWMFHGIYWFSMIYHTLPWEFGVPQNFLTKVKQVVFFWFKILWFTLW